MPTVKQILKWIFIVLPIVALAVLSILLLTEKHTLQTENKETGETEFTNIGIMFIVVGVVAGIIIIYYLIIKPLTKAKEKSVVKKEQVFPSLDISKAKKAFIKKLIKENIIGGVLEGDKIIEYNRDDIEFGSHGTSVRKYYKKPGYNHAMFLDIIVRIKNPEAPANYQGSHRLWIPLTTEQDIMNENFDYFERRIKFKVHRQKADFPQDIEVSEEETRLEYLREIGLPDVDVLLKRREPREAEELRRTGQELAKLREQSERLLEEQEKAREVKAE